MVSGAFGTGAGFAMEDGWLLAQLLELSLDTHRGETKRTALQEALERFDEIRSPYYHKIYDVLDSKPSGKVDYAAWSPTPGGPLDWIYFHDVGEEWKRFRAEHTIVR